MRFNQFQVRELIERSDKMVEKCICILFAKQTTDEQCSKQTRWWNHRGFSASNAKRGTEYAERIERGEHLEGDRLVQARAICLTHNKQLTRILNERD